MLEALKDGKHPAWTAIIIGLLMITLTIVNTFNYEHGFDWIKDPRGQVVTAIVVGAGLWLKQRLTT